MRGAECHKPVEKTKARSFQNMAFCNASVVACKYKNSMCVSAKEIEIGGPEYLTGKLFSVRKRYIYLPTLGIFVG